MGEVPRRLTPEAEALLRAADAGGVPMFTSANLRRIASENGVDVSSEMTPNDVIAALRARQAGPIVPVEDDGVKARPARRKRPTRARRRRV